MKKQSTTDAKRAAVGWLRAGWPGLSRSVRRPGISPFSVMIADVPGCLLQRRH